MPYGRFRWLAVCVAGATNVGAATGMASEVKSEVERLLQLDADPAYGEYLAGECVTCHSPGASDPTGRIPPIAGLPKDYFLKSLLEYGAGIRDNPVMQSRVARLGAPELAALAAYFHALPPE